ncbi:MAG: hypothetical protein IBX47_13220 [Desulfuromonadales bacterium]|nr:hypothetical protein [Desulfuromonadales bacterium]
MSEDLFRIVTSGKIVAGRDRVAVEANLQQLTKFGSEKLAKLFTGRTVVIKSGLTAATAERYRAALTRAGMACTVLKVPSVESSTIQMATTVPPAEGGTIEMAGTVNSLSVHGVSSSQVVCPQCGTVQPKAESCISCQIVMQRYRSPQSEAFSPADPFANPYANPYAEPEAKRSFPLGNLLILLVVAIGISAWIVLANPFASTAGDLDAAAGLYENSHFKFALSFPSDWKHYSVDEAILCATIRRDYADQYLLLISPISPEHSLMVVNIAGTTLESFKSIGWDGMVKSSDRRNKTLYESVKQVNGITVYRVGYKKELDS